MRDTKTAKVPLPSAKYAQNNDDLATDYCLGWDIGTYGGMYLSFGSICIVNRFIFCGLQFNGIRLEFNIM